MPRTDWLIRENLLSIWSPSTIDSILIDYILSADLLLISGRNRVMSSSLIELSPYPATTEMCWGFQWEVSLTISAEFRSKPFLSGQEPTILQINGSKQTLEVELVCVALAVHLAHDVLVVVVAKCSRHFVVIHVRLRFSLTPFSERNLVPRLLWIIEIFRCDG